MRPILKTKMFMYQSKAYLDEKFLFGKIAQQSDLEISEMMVRCIFGNKDSKFHSGP